jgi:hypothetical protein
LNSSLSELYEGSPNRSSIHLPPPTNIKEKHIFQSKNKIMSKLFEAPCDECSVTEDNSGSCSDLSFDSADSSASSSYISANYGDWNSADHEVQPNPAYEEAMQMTKQNPTTARRDTFPSQHMLQHPVPPAKLNGIQEAPSTAPEMVSKSKVARGDLAPHTRPTLRVNKSFEAGRYIF